MATVERTAYPRFPKVFSTKELQACYTPDAEELEWVTRSTRGQGPRLGLLVLLKVFQQLHYFPNLDSIPVVVIDHVRASACLAPDAAFGYDRKLSPTLYRHYTAVREFLGVQAYIGTDANKVTIRSAREAAETMDQQVDIVNATIDALILHQVELPAFSTLDNIAEQIQTRTQTALFRCVARRLSDEERQRLDRLLTREFTNRLTAYNNIKRHARRPSRKHLSLLIEHLTLLDGLGDFSCAIAGVPASKLRSLASQAMSLDAANLREILPEKRYTLIVALLNHMRVRTRDDLAEMFIRRMGAIHKRARDEMERIQSRQRAQMEKLVTLLDGVVDIVADGQDDALIGRQVRRFLAPSGDLEQLRESCAEVRAFSGNNYLPLLWRHFRAHRSVMLRLAQVLEWESTSQSRTLLAALAVVLDNASLHLCISASRMDRRRRRCELRLGTMAQAGAPPPRPGRPHQPALPGTLRALAYGQRAAFRRLVRGGVGCLCRLPCAPAALARMRTAPARILRQAGYAGQRAGLRGASTPVADRHGAYAGCQFSRQAPARHHRAGRRTRAQADNRQGDPGQRDRPATGADPAHADAQSAGRAGQYRALDPLHPALWATLRQRSQDPQCGRALPAGHLRHGLQPGAHPGRPPYGGSGHAAQMSFVNRRHLSLERLETAQRELIELYLRLDLPKHWGDGKTVAADGTQYDFYDNNLLAGYHFRYRKMGAVAYRHVADNYIAVFRHFIPPGVWEAIYVIEGLLKAGLSVEADTVHADTQGQSAAVFAFTHLLGINLMPRIRNWQDLKLYRADTNTKYKHIDRLFSDNVDWDLIAFHRQDLMQVALSIQSGTISSPLLLRRFGSESRRNRLFLAAQELGKVVRTAFLLEWIGSRELRQEITATTNKIESYNGFAKWFAFGGDVLAENDPDEQQKRLRYNDLIASAVILQNTVDMMQALRAMVKEGIKVDVADIGFLSPYLTSNIKRFGDYKLNLERVPEAWIRDSLFAAPAHSVRKPRHA